MGNAEREKAATPSEAPLSEWEVTRIKPDYGTHLTTQVLLANSDEAKAALQVFYCLWCVFDIHDVWVTLKRQISHKYLHWRSTFMGCIISLLSSCGPYLADILRKTRINHLYQISSLLYSRVATWRASQVCQCVSKACMNESPTWGIFSSGEHRRAEERYPAKTCADLRSPTGQTSQHLWGCREEAFGFFGCNCEILRWASVASSGMDWWSSTYNVHHSQQRCAAVCYSGYCSGMLTLRIEFASITAFDNLP